jgi:hypothetical protein
MTPNGLAGRFDAALYNSLGAVEDADRSVRAGGALDAFLLEAADILVAHDMQDRFGVSLLHKHMDCAAGERMIETPIVFQGQDALCTGPTGARSVWNQAVPTVWALRDEGFAPLEYTTDPLATERLGQGAVAEGFLAAFRQAVARSPIGSLMGLAVVTRRLYAEAAADQIGLEYSNLVPRSSIVVMTDRHGRTERSVETRWAFKKSIDTVSACVQQCLTICHLGDGPGGHTGKQVHTPGRHKW